MIADSRPQEEGTDSQQLPGAWEQSAPDAHGVVVAFDHAVTGQTVRVRRQKRPTQMHDPMTATDDTGFRTLVEGEHAAPVSHDLSDESVARQVAREFMAAYPDGDFEIPDPKEQPYGGRAVEW